MFISVIVLLLPISINDTKAQVQIPAKTCTLSLTGKLIDPITNNIVSGAKLALYYQNDTKLNSDETAASIISTTNDRGFFSFDNLCSGSYHIIIRRNDWIDEKRYLDIQNDTAIVLKLSSHQHLSKEISVFGELHSHQTDHSLSVTSAEMIGRSDLNFAEILQSLPGVSTIRTGNNISKPVVDGIYGSRLSIISGSAVLSNQNWGLDHAPELDPLNAGMISVVKGVDMLRYQGSQIGANVVMETDEPIRDPHLHGSFKTFGVTNGWGAGTNLSLTTGGDNHGVRATFTAKRSGDLSTPDYYLNNTGQRQLSGSITAEYEISQDFKTELDYSIFDTELGILRGAHISNLSDLERNFSRDRPFYTEEVHSHVIEPPRQRATHNQVSFGTTYTGIEDISAELNLSYQHNQRDEFDRRRGGRSNIPAMSLSKHTFLTDFNTEIHISDQLDIMSGVQWTTIENINIPGTGVLPFIPNYHENVIGMFGIAEYMAGSVIYDFGARYDFTNRNSTRRIRSPQNSNIERYDRNYHISTLTAGLSSDIIEQEVGLNIKYTGRVPDVSELYSQGLHQGTGTLEFGNPDIDQENAIILNTSSSGFILDNLSYDLHGYFRLFDNYIYLIATGENRLTIRGSYPVFEYRQTSAAIYGADLALQYDFTEEVHVYAGGSILRGDDLSEDQPLVNMAPNSTFVRADYHNEGFLWFDSSDFLLEYRYTFRQNHLLESQDILLPPDGYGLLGGTIKLKRTIGSDVLSFNLRFDNILNTVYRDYLNRLRYFADGTGFSASLIINYEF